MILSVWRKAEAQLICGSYHGTYALIFVGCLKIREENGILERESLSNLYSWGIF